MLTRFQSANKSGEKNNEGTQPPEDFAQPKASATTAGARFNEPASKVSAISNK